MEHSSARIADCYHEAQGPLFRPFFNQEPYRALCRHEVDFEMHKRTLGHSHLIAFEFRLVPGVPE